ncbi:cation:dicarboxylate symporter family transporter [Mycobacteroides abscessus]|uniref:cation:dicarboxylate symporter family transporter n=1 Tax=Mycobacteroides abscessus TaxID=36809 RepID=UPI0005E4D570|nr:cation:dicarboxylase symporter family transporter [Mycobacteroides abscessus]CPS03486.1 Probable sodium:dicarboxylate symporter [Mycobacteroides abscessus]CPS19912.1 Probable sodium:dicarboxylate symporter [Mycobacteroides abscessus]CPS24730.1 Probable sodium:dicarboxylate symporter [Mycobacteroides abscessus]CPS92422.1 Probable sodium:dicarboxylate symporter [Mycobacteroides abscessus]CPT47670.1 Probable sodium:dicarboxylate symporter [Mycobacteroides abscessus]
MTATEPATSESTPPKKHKDRTHWLYIAVVVAVVLGVAVGMLWPGFGKSVGVLGEIFVSLIKMMISPVIFCTIVLGIGSVRKAASVGRVGGLAFVYFLAMSTVALAIGLVVGNLLAPGTGLHLSGSNQGAGAKYVDQAHAAGGTWHFIKSIVPETMFSALTSGSVLQTLFIALLVGFAVQALGGTGESIVRGVGMLQKLVFKVLIMVLWLAPIGAFGAIANVVGQTGWDAVKELGTLMLGFYVTCAIFIFGVLGALLWLVSRVSIFRLAREYLLIVSTSSSESALPRLIAKMAHLGVDKSTVGIVVPTGYSFNLDGTAIYLTMASLFVADAMGAPLSVGEQISLLAFMMIASKGAAGVTGAGMATLAAGLQSHRPDLVDGVGMIVGIDRFMSEARALTNFSGNAVATLLIATWTKTMDRDRVKTVLSGADPFDETTMLDDHAGEAVADKAVS